MKLVTIKNLPNNNRFYVLIFAFLLSVFVLCLLRLNITSDQLFYIRLEQVFGFLAVVFLYIALLIAPIEKLVGKRPWVQNLLFARRAIGVSAAYFAALHAGIALWAQIGGVGGLAILPQKFLWALIFGAVALVILLLMAATSFNKVIAFMTFRKWKWLHRLVYIACVLLILHVWMIGTHLAYAWVQIAAFVPLSALFGLEAWCMVQKYAQNHPTSWVKEYAVGVIVAVWLVTSTLLFALPTLVKSYHSDHAQHSGAAND